MGTNEQDRAERRLAAILAADIAGYSRLIGADEEGTLRRLRSIRAEILDPAIAANRGRLVKTTGDGLLVEFASVVDAMRCAVEIQRAIADRAASIPPDQRLEYRIGIHQGDVVVENGDIFGDGVNIAARLEGIAEPGGICLSARVQEDAAGRLDLAFEDMGEQRLKNIARPVRVYRVRDPLASGTAEAPSAHATFALPEKPSIAVLPFQNMSGDPEQDYFADGMVEEIITALSKIKWFFVLARNSSFTYKGRSVDVKVVGRELGVRYVLEGSVRKSGDRVRITAQLIDAASGNHLWADRFDGLLADIFDVQDSVAQAVAGVIEPELQSAETARTATRPTTDLSAYDAYLRAYAMVLGSAKQIPRALASLEEAIARDPLFGPALAWAAICCTRLLIDGSSESADSDCQKGIAYAKRALQTAHDDPVTLANAAFALAQLGEDIGAMTALVDRALAANPSYARGWYIRGQLKNFAGEHDAAIESAEAALRLSPRGRIGMVMTLMGGALFFSGRFDEAVPKLRLAIEDEPSFPHPYRLLASCYAHMGRLSEARAAIAELRGHTKVLIPPIQHWRNPEHGELFLSGLRLAMGQSG